MRIGNRGFCRAATVMLAVLLAQTAFAFRPEIPKVAGTNVQVMQSASLQVKVPVPVDRQTAAEQRPDLSVKWNEFTGSPSVVCGKDLLMEGAKVAAKQVGPVDNAALGVKAIAVMNKLKGLYGIQDVSQEFRPGQTAGTTAGYRHVRLNQEYQGLPVFGPQLIVHFDGQGTARSVNGGYCPVGELGTVPTLTADQALTVARADQQALGNPAGQVTAGPALVVFARKMAPTLAWQLTIEHSGAGVVGRWRYWVNALTGAILLNYNDVPKVAPTPNIYSGVPATINGDILMGEGGGSVSVAGWEQGGYYYLHSFTNLWSVRNAGGGGHSGDVDAFGYASRTGTPNWVTSDRSEMSAGKNLETMLNYYKTVHNRNSFDDAGTMTPAYVHQGSSYSNAFWDGTALYIGDGDGVSADPLGVMDIMAHEFQHGVTEFSANLIYQDESGQLSESFSDIFGFLNEYASQPDGRAAYPGRVAGQSDWLMGEDSWLESTALRDMRDPANTNTVSSAQPTRYHGSHWFYGSDDNGGVHYNCSIQNFMFYLLCEGGVGSNDNAIAYFVPPIGIPAAERLAYDTLTGYMTLDTDYVAAREAWVACATDSDEAGRTTNAAIAVGQAWAAVGIGTGSLIIPDEPFVVGSEPGSGIYVPSNKVYTLLGASLSNATTWGITSDQPWVKIDPASVVVPLGVISMAVTVSVDQVVADALPAGTYVGSITFSNNYGVFTTTEPAVLCIVSNYTVRGEPYAWIDPTFHTRINVGSGVSSARTIPFNVSLYGNTSRTIYISSRGMLGFSPTSMSSAANLAIPDWRTPNDIIAPMWGPISAGVTLADVCMAVLGVAPNRRAVITWKNAQATADVNARFSFQAIIEENASLADNDIVFNYQDVAEDRPIVGFGEIATVGIENRYGAMGRQFSCNTNWLINEVALRFTHSSATDTNAPVGQARAIGPLGSTVSFELRFNEPVVGLTTNGISLAGSTVPGVYVAGINGGGFRYVVEVGNVSSLGQVELSVLGGAVQDLSGNPNAPFGPAIYVVPVEKTSFVDDMEIGVAGWTVSTQVFLYIDTRGWKWGVPTYGPGPAAANSPTHCWSTTLDGPCSNDMSKARLISAPISVDASPVLEFSMWSGSGSYGTLEVNPGTGWIDMTPMGPFGPYLYDLNEIWERIVVPLDNARFGNKTIQVRFTASRASNQAGLYIDDVKVTCDRSPAVWVVDYSPTNGSPSTLVPVTVTAYNSTTNTYVGITGHVGSPESGVTITSGVPLAYGTMLPGAFSSGTGPVGVQLGSAGQFEKPVIQLAHDALLGDVLLAKQVLPFDVSGVTATVATNTLTVMCMVYGVGVTNFLGEYLKGDGGPTSYLYQVIYAGANGTNDPPASGGQVTGDDHLLYSSDTGLPWGEFGGGGVPNDIGQFNKTFLHGLPVGARVYVRAYDGASFKSAIAYGDSARYLVSNRVSEVHDFGGWGVGAVIDPTRDSNGDTIPDGVAIANGLDPRDPIVGLPGGWVLQRQFGSGGNSSGQFSTSLPSPTRVLYKNHLLFVLDTGHNKIQVWNRFTGAYVGSYGSLGEGNGQFLRPYGMAMDPRPGTNRLAVVDQGNYRVQVLDFNPTTGTNMTYLFSFGETNSLPSPKDVAIAPDGRFYVTEEFSVRIYSATGVYQALLASGGAAAGSVVRPWGVAVGTDGQVVVADSENNRIQSWNSAGTWLWATGTQGSASGQLNGPKDVAFGPGGFVYVADTVNARMALYRSSGQFVANLGIHGSSFEIQMVVPYSLDPVLNSNVVYVADTFNNRVLAVTAIYDGDGDGMDDVWEILHGLDPTNPNDAMLDFDGDGLSNLGEYRLQQDPGEGVTITAFSVNPQVLRWQSVSSSGVYQIQYAHGATGLMSTNNWQAGPVVTSQVAGALSVTNLMTLTNSVQFIRVLKVGP